MPPSTPRQLIAIDEGLIHELQRLLTEIRTELERCRTELLQRADADEPIGVEEAAKYLGLSPAALYQNVGKIPSHKRNGRRYYFRSELRAYILTGTN